MTTSFTSTKRPWIFGLCALGLTVLGWFWLIVCFTARYGAWWNSLYLFAAIYSTSAIIAFRGIRSILGILGFVFALLSLGFVLIFLVHELRLDAST